MNFLSNCIASKLLFAFMTVLTNCSDQFNFMSKITPNTLIDFLDALTALPSMITIGATSSLLNNHTSVLSSLSFDSNCLNHFVIGLRVFPYQQLVQGVFCSNEV